jgi:hypothetical protein
MAEIIIPLGVEFFNGQVILVFSIHDLIRDTSKAVNGSSKKISCFVLSPHPCFPPREVRGGLGDMSKGK